MLGLTLRRAERRRLLRGGTTLLDLMKPDVMAPRTLIDINPLQAEHGGIATDRSGLTLGGLTRMSAAADHPEVATSGAGSSSDGDRNVASASSPMKRTRSTSNEGESGRVTRLSGRAR